MKALILAAGLGSRLKEKTVQLPKALVPVGMQPILAYQMKALLENGIKEIGLVVGHQGDRLISYMQENFPKVHFSFVWNREYQTTNSSYSFWLARDWIGGEHYLHLNCDVIFSPTLLKKLIDFPHSDVLAVRTDVPLGGRLEHVALEGDRIVEMSITRTDRSVGKAFGLAKLGPESTRFLTRRIGQHIEQGDKNQNCFGMIREAVSHVDCRALVVKEDLLMEVNTLEDWKQANEALS
ncbi:MAG: phosphocholine cytidylyltransferase family protein [Deltaproteobacteria bacterium]|nr:phosphocholine cytidylyltransferase family protein [Deltaproteobacteria bacterium]MBI2501037.1 phosphocholine cytidylyltransferase family protein [Deltaproteobacteria bacterium]